MFHISGTTYNIIKCLTELPVRTSLSSFSQHLVSGAVVIGGDDPHTEVLTTWHPGHRTAVGGGGAVVGFSGVPLCFYSVGKSSSGGVPGCDQHVRVTLSSCLYVCW